MDNNYNLPNTDETVNSNQYNYPPAYNMPQQPIEQDKVNVGFCILGWFIPLFALIYFLTKKQEKPKGAKAVGIVGLVSFILNLIVVIASFAFTGSIFNKTIDTVDKFADSSFVENINDATPKKEELIYNSTEAFEYSDVEDGIIITHFTNYDNIEYDKIYVPNEIDGKKVVGIGTLGEEHYVMRSIYGKCEVVIPNTVEYIGDYAFFFTKGLTKVSGGENCTTIGEYAFAECENLEEITFIDNVSDLADSAFIESPKLNLDTTTIKVKESNNEEGSSIFPNWNTVVINGETIQLPIKYSEFSEKTGYKFQFSKDADKELESNNTKSASLVNNYEGIGVKLLNKDAQTTTLNNCYIITVAVDEDSRKDIKFINDLYVGKSIIKDEVVEMLGNPNSSHSYFDDKRNSYNLVYCDDAYKNVFTITISDNVITSVEIICYDNQ